jgi:general secretion pathway protein L
MPRTIIGLDIGATTIKAVEISASYKNYEIVNCYSSPRTQPENEEQSSSLVDDLREFFNKYELDRENVVTTLPYTDFFVRRLFMPFSDKKKIGDILPFQIQDRLPIFEQEMTYDFTVSSAGKGPADLMVAAVPNENISRYLEELKKADLDPKLLDTSAGALINLKQGSPLEHDSNVFVEIGKTHTTICYCVGIRAEIIRTLPYGGESFTEALADALGVPFEEAEQYKLSHCFFGTRSDFDLPEKVSQAANDWVERIARSLKLSLHKLLNDPESIYPTILLCGGGSLMEGLADELENRTELEAFSFDPLADQPNTKCEIPPQSEIYSVALGLAIKDTLGNKSPSFNFRKGPFVYLRAAGDLRNRLIYSGVMLGLILILGLSSVFSGLFSKKAESAALDRQMLEIFKETFPNVPPVDPIEQMRQMVVSVRDGSSSIENTITFIDAFRQISEKTPEDLSVKLSELTFDPESMKIRGETTSYEAVDRIKTGIETIPEVKSVSVKETRGCGRNSENCIKFTIALDLTEQQETE